jgi:hypothetical protein
MTAISGPAHSITHDARMVTPTDAKEWLKTKRSDKRINRQQVRGYAEDMRAQRWMLNGDPIIFGKSGQLLSGVLRLHACIEADTAFPCLIIRGVDDPNFETIDSVRRRTLADILTIRKEPKGRMLAAALVALWRYANDDYVSPTRSPSAHALLQLLENNPGIRDSMKLVQDVSRLMSIAVGGALHYLFTQANPSRADTFFEQLLDEEVAHGPVFLLRQQLTRLKSARGTKSQGLLIGLTIKAWEAFAAGEDMKQLRFVPGNDNPPRISNLDETSLRAGVANESATMSAVPFAKRTISVEMPKIEVEFRQISPEAAEEMLKCNDANRGVAWAVVEKYARDMNRHSWALNGQTIKFGKSGRLLDGQHRLHASLHAKTSFPAIVVRGLDDAVFDTFDLGSRRAIGDVLRDRGELNTSSLGAALRQLWLLEHGLIQSRGAAPTIAELLNVLEQNPDIRDSVRLQHKIRNITAPSIIITLHYLFSRVDKSRADGFLDRLSDGADLPTRHPILTLRDQLLRARNERKLTISDAERAAWAIKAWNAYIQERPVAALKWQQLGPRKEAFPEIAGLQDLRRSLAA